MEKWGKEILKYWKRGRKVEKKKMENIGASIDELDRMKSTDTC